MYSNNMKKQIENRMSVLIGKRARMVRRAALMLGVDFGEDIEYEHIVGINRGKINKTPEYSLHVHTAWRLLKNGIICLSQCSFFDSANGFRWLKEQNETTDSSPFSRLSNEFNERLTTEAVIVTGIEATELGDLKINMGNKYCLEIFVDSIENIESWRFFRNDHDSQHLVVHDQEDKAK
jgi:hypothetical protein